MMQIRAAVAGSNGKLSMQELTLDAPRAHEMLVRIVACGICRLDVAMIGSPRVSKPAVLGHEGCGIVEEIGRDVTGVCPGDRVVMSFNSCGHCSSCENGAPAYCLQTEKHNFSCERPDRTTALSSHGERVGSHFFGQSAFATHAICTDRNIVKIPDDVPLELMAPLGCGIQTGAGAVLNSLKVKPASSVAVVGTGSVGLAAIMAARIAGAASIIAVDVHASRLEAARALGATHTIQTTVDRLAAEIIGITGNGVNYAVDTSGNDSVIHQAIQALAPLGVIALVSEGSGAAITVQPIQMMLTGRSIRGVHQGDSVPQTFIPALIEHYRHGRLPLEKIVTFYDFDQIDKAMTDMIGGRTIKPVLRMTDSKF
jgi:aryl-alcohol dehydrogenase